MPLSDGRWRRSCKGVRFGPVSLNLSMCDFCMYIFEYFDKKYELY